MDTQNNRFIRVTLKLIKILLTLTALTPLVFSQEFLFPFIGLKIFYVRALIQTTFALTAIVFLYAFFFERNVLASFWQQRKSNAGVYAKTLFYTALLYFFSQAVSVFLSDNSYRAFWGTLDRGEGLFGLAHFAILALLAVIFFSRKDFAFYFKLSIVVGFILYFYAFLQTFNITKFPFALAPSSRPGSFLGNPAFFAAYSFFVMISSTVTLWFSRAKRDTWEKRWFNLSLVVLFSSPLIIFLTRTRGAMLGFGIMIVAALVYVLFRKGNSTRSIFKIRFFAVVLLSGIIAMSGVILITRTNPAWQEIPGFDRLTQTLISFREDPSIQTRFLDWKIGWKAFLGKPIFGWGPEGYLFAFQKLYNPEVSVYGETWLDRVHNNFINVAVSQGLFGLLLYLVFFAGILYFFFKKGSDTPLRVFIGITLLGYAVQNIFIFDEFHSYTPFFILIGAVMSGFFDKEESRFLEEKEAPVTQKSKYASQKTTRRVFGIAAVLIIVMGLYVALLYTTVLTPATQAYVTHQTESAKSKADFFKKFDKATQAYNFTQYSIRSHLMDFFYTNQDTIFTNPQFADVAERLTRSVEEVLKKEPFDIRLHIRLSQAYLVVAKRDSTFYSKAEEVSKEGLSMSPLHQDLVYSLGIALAGQERYEESFDVFKKSISSNPKIARLRIYYGVALAAAGKNTEAIQELNSARKLHSSLGLFSKNDIDTMLSMYELLNDEKSVIDIVTDSIKGNTSVKFAISYYEKALLYYLERKDKEQFLTAANFVAENFPERREDMRIIVDNLLKNNQWPDIVSY